LSNFLKAEQLFIQDDKNLLDGKKEKWKISTGLGLLIKKHILRSEDNGNIISVPNFYFSCIAYCFSKKNYSRWRIEKVFIVY